jgi:2-polyprenyl-3-methyl-5-hydroxy-6-metoxy-1,4-benzoquinol methylase
MMMRIAAALDAPSQSGIDWDDTDCPLCGERDEKLLFEATDANPGDRVALRFAVVQCRKCELTYTNPRPGLKSIGNFYPADYRPHRRPRKIEEVNRPSSPMAHWTGRAVPERDGSLPWLGQGRLLDFGCGGGSYLQRMADQGWQVTGLDAAVGAVQHIRQELGLKALVGSLPHPELQPASFDVVTMWHSIEHVHAPLEILREAYQLLVPGGKLIVACPNIDSWAFRVFGQNWFGLDVPRHLTHFTPTTMNTMLLAAGFQVDAIRLIRHSDWLRSSAKIATQSGHNWAKPLTWKPIAKAAAYLTYLNRSTDCMIAVAQRPGVSK